MLERTSVCRNGNRKVEKQKIVPFKKTWLALFIPLWSTVSYGWFQQIHRPESVHFEMESLLIPLLKGEEKQHNSQTRMKETPSKKWKANKNGSSVWQNSGSPPWGRETNSVSWRLSVSCRVQCEILLHLLFCRLPFEYFVCRTTLGDLREAKKLKSVKQHRVSAERLPSGSTAQNWVNPGVESSFRQFRSIGHFLFTNMQQRLGEKAHMHWFGDWKHNQDAECWLTLILTDNR